MVQACDSDNDQPFGATKSYLLHLQVESDVDIVEIDLMREDHRVSAISNTLIRE
jgi:hypothetical protein